MLCKFSQTGQRNRWECNENLSVKWIYAPRFGLPNLNGVVLSLLGYEKILGIYLDSRLNGKLTWLNVFGD